MDSHPFKLLVCFLRSFFSVLEKSLLSFLSFSFWTGKHLCVWLEWWDSIHLCQCYAWVEVPLEFIQSGCVSSQVCVRSGKLPYNLYHITSIETKPFLFITRVTWPKHLRQVKLSAYEKRNSVLLFCFMTILPFTLSIHTEFRKMRYESLWKPIRLIIIYDLIT